MEADAPVNIPANSFENVKAMMTRDAVSKDQGQDGPSSTRHNEAIQKKFNGIIMDN